MRLFCHVTECVAVSGEELDISHPMLTELDTSQIIRSYIGVELAGVDGSVSTSDELASGLASHNDFSSELDVSSSTDDDDDDISLHIRDEACQTGDADDDSSAAESRLRRYPVKLGCGGVAASTDDEMSVWRTLLHGGDSYNDVDSHDVVKYMIANRHAAYTDESLDEIDMSFHDTEDDNTTMSDPILTKELAGTSSEICSQQGGIVLCGSSYRLSRSQSDSSLLASAARPASWRESRNLSVACIVAPVKSQLSDTAKRERSRQMGSARSREGTETSLSKVLDVSTDRAEEIACARRSVEGERAVGWTSSSDDTSPVKSQSPKQSATVTVESPLSDDAMSMATSTSKSSVCIPPPVAKTTRTHDECDGVRAKAGAVPPARVTCMDHQVCGLLADFVAHL